MSGDGSAINGIRIGGLASGLDTDSIVESLMKAELAKVFRIEQEKTYANWQMEAYRGVIDDINNFSKSQYNLLDSSKNILSTATLKSVSVLSNTDYVSIIASGDAASGSYAINEIVQLAKAAVTESNTSIKDGIKSTIDMSAAPALEVQGKSFFIRLDGIQEKIVFEENYLTKEGLAEGIQEQVNRLFGTGRINISFTDDQFLTMKADNSTLQVLSDSESSETLSYLGMTSGAISHLNVITSLEQNFGTLEDVSFSINGVDFTFTKDSTVKEVIDQINNSEAKVRLSYDSIKDTMTLESTKTGAGSLISIKNTTGDFFGADSYFKIAAGDITNGQDAKFYLNDNGKTNLISRSTNVFTIDDITYSLKKEVSTETSFTITDNVTQTFDKIKSFISDYNDMLEKIYSKINEKRDYSYKPLSSTQKESMTEEEVTDWETKAKAGILKSDNLLYNIYNELRNAFLQKIEGASDSFKNIGISTTAYSTNGRIDIDESKLRAALEKNMDNVMGLIGKKSSVAYSRTLTAEEQLIRFNESGLAERISDILKKNTTTIRDSRGLKGLLIEKAGVSGDTSEFKNTISSRITQIDSQLKLAMERMNSQEDTYWAKFSALEQAIQTMNSRSSWLNSQLG